MTSIVVERSGAHAGRVHTLGELTSIGRADENDVVVANAQVSRRHALIRRIGDSYVVEDLGSKNGVFVNGERVSGSRTVGHGDEIHLPGLVLLFRADEDTLTATVLERRDASGTSGVIVNGATAEVFVDGRPVQVTAKEFLAVSCLATKRGALVTKEDLANQVWPEYKGDISDASIEQLISRLRHKLEPSAKSRYLITVRGLGYRLVGGPPADP